MCFLTVNDVNKDLGPKAKDLIPKAKNLAPKAKELVSEATSSLRSNSVSGKLQILIELLKMIQFDYQMICLEPLGYNVDAIGWATGMALGL